MDTNKKISTNNIKKSKRSKMDTQTNNPNVINNINITIINTNSSNQRWSICGYLWLIFTAIFVK